MISMSLVLVFIWLHFVADFLLQTDWMAVNKSSRIEVLSVHVLVYSLPFFVFGAKFAVATFCLHWLTDFVSSRLTTMLWKKQLRHWFFVVIGADQALHFTALILTYKLFK